MMKTKYESKSPPDKVGLRELVARCNKSPRFTHPESSSCDNGTSSQREKGTVKISVLEVPQRPQTGALQPEKRGVWEQQLSTRRFRIGEEDGDKNVPAPRAPVVFF